MATADAKRWAGEATVVLLGGVGIGKTAIWLSLAAALGGGALRLEEAGGAIAPLPWAVVRHRYLPTGAAHGVRVARASLGTGRGVAWPRTVRLVDGPGLGSAAGAAEAQGRLLAECLRAGMILHVVALPERGEGAAVDAAVAQFARARSLCLERVCLVPAGARTPAGVCAVRSAQRRHGPPGNEARPLAALVRARLGGGEAPARAFALPWRRPSP